MWFSFIILFSFVGMSEYEYTKKEKEKGALHTHAHAHHPTGTARTSTTTPCTRLMCCRLPTTAWDRVACVRYVSGVLGCQMSAVACYQRNPYPCRNSVSPWKTAWPRSSQQLCTTTTTLDSTTISIRRSVRILGMSCCLARLLVRTRTHTRAHLLQNFVQRSVDSGKPPLFVRVRDDIP